MNKNYNRRINEEYGDWIVIDLDESRLRSNMNGVHLHYILECKKCKKRRIVAANDLSKLKKEQHHYQMWLMMYLTPITFQSLKSHYTSLMHLLIAFLSQ